MGLSAHRGSQRAYRRFSVRLAKVPPGGVFRLVSMAFTRCRASAGLCAVRAPFVAGLLVFRWGLHWFRWCLVHGLAGVPLWFPRRLCAI